ncbi:MAG: hypothetical protein JW894_06370 [Bacteroidales bacterium]|nr:hypothetical protein [Bacteroidales bacterium]
MKIYFSIFLLFTGLVLKAQIQPDSTTVMYSWKLENNYSTLTLVEIDTNLPNFQILYPIYHYSINNSFLGNFGSPVIQNVYTDRIFHEDAFFLNCYLPYLHTEENTAYFNSKKPFSRLSYSSSGSAVSKEQSFEAFHTQNITPKFNFGFRYHVISSKGQYRYLAVKKNAFRIFSSYTGDRYMAHAVFNVNRYKGGESGGLSDTSMTLLENNYHIAEDGTESYSYRYDLETRFNGSGQPYFTSNAHNRIRYYDILLSQRVKLFTLASKVDSSKLDKGRSFAEPVLTYSVKANRAIKAYDDIDPLDPGYYNTFYFNTENTYDSITNFKVTNTAQLEFKTTFRGKVQVGIFGAIKHEYKNYTLYSEWDTTYVPGDTLITVLFEESDINGNGILDTLKGVKDIEHLQNTYVSAGIYGNLWNKVKTRFSGTICLIGEKAGETMLEGFIDTKISLFNREFEFGANGAIESKMPGYLYNHYYSNHYMWNQSLSPEYHVYLSSVIASPSNNFEIRGNYHVLRNYIYFGKDIVPQNYGEILNYFSIGVDKTFNVWRLFSVNKIVYQATENKEVLPLPDIVYYNSTYIDYTFNFEKTGGKLQVMLGFDLFYNTSFNGYEYSPALAQFYTQSDNYIGNYPLVDAFLNIKLKRTRFFFKMQHFYTLFDKYNGYYSTVRYPYNQYALKFGISWTFYD